MQGILSADKLETYRVNWWDSTEKWKVCWVEERSCWELYVQCAVIVSTWYVFIESPDEIKKLRKQILLKDDLYILAQKSKMSAKWEWEKSESEMSKSIYIDGWI